MIRKVVMDKLSLTKSTKMIQSWARQNINLDKQNYFIAAVEEELLALHEGNFIIYQISPQAFSAWQALLAQKNKSLIMTNLFMTFLNKIYDLKIMSIIDTKGKGPGTLWFLTNPEVILKYLHMIKKINFIRGMTLYTGENIVHFNDCLVTMPITCHRRKINIIKTKLDNALF